jgi:hypothetical protein
MILEGRRSAAPFHLKRGTAMKLATAIHQIIQRSETIEPGDVFETNEISFAELERMGAARAPTSDEISLHRLSQGQPEFEVAPAIKPVAPVDERADLEARAEAAGVKFDKRWGNPRLLEEILKAEEAIKNPDPDVTEL